MNMPNRWIVLTGASTGIGRAAAFQLARAGFGVLAGYRKDADAQSLRDEARSLGLVERVEPIRLDVTDQGNIDACAERVRSLVSAGAELKALINNAGFLVFGPVETLPVADWKRQFDTNFFGAIAMTQAMMPFLLASKGRVVNISSIGGKVSQPLIGSYVASKFAMEAMTDALRMEVSRQGVGVILIEPGAIKTPIWEKGTSQEAAAIAALPASSRDRYEPMLRRLGAAASKMATNAIAPDICAAQIVRAVTMRRPFARKLVGTDARVLSLLKWVLPTRMMDAFIMRAFGL